MIFSKTRAFIETSMQRLTEPFDKAPVFSLWSLGFRPFFLLASLWAVVSVFVWVGMYQQGIVFAPYYPPQFWHSHEMIYGYTVAVIAGFLLAAVRNWTGMMTLNGVPLVGLTVLWLVGRILPFASAIAPDLVVPNVVIASVDSAFLPVLAAVLARPIIKAKNYRNLFVVVLLMVLMVNNICFHYFLSQGNFGAVSICSVLPVYLVMFLIAVIAGRVFPFFTKNGIRPVVFEPKRWPWVERLSLASLILLALTVSLGDLMNDGIQAFLFIFAGLMHLLRYFQWYHPAVLRVPLLWVLHGAYLWLVIGLLFMGANYWMAYPESTILHMFNYGVIGLITLGMMARVSLGHTGRELRVGKDTATAFGLLFAGAVIRSVLPIVFEANALAVSLSGGLWCLAFGFFFVRFVPVWWYSRVDGMPG